MMRTGGNVEVRNEGPDQRVRDAADRRAVSDARDQDVTIR